MHTARVSMAAEVHRALELVVRARELANEPVNADGLGRWRFFVWAGSWARWASMGLFRTPGRSQGRGEAHARLLLVGGGDRGATLWYDMFCKGATPSALFSAGCTAAVLPSMGIGVLEWHEDAGFGARELAAIGGNFQDLLNMGFTVGLMFRWRPMFGPHVLSASPFDVTFDVLSRKMGCTLNELVFDHNATSGDLALLRLDWGQALKLGFGQEHVRQMGESYAGIESSLGAPLGALARELNDANEVKEDPRGTPRVPISSNGPHLRIGCKSFKL